jgi:hypothetical protein
MLWLLILAAPICIELAGWVVDASLLVPLLNEPRACQLDDAD